MIIHPAMQGKEEIFEDAILPQLGESGRIAGVAEEHRRDVAAHMARLGVDQLHAFVVRVLFTGVVQGFGEMRHAENVKIFIAVRFPELGFFQKNVLFGVNKKAGVSRQRKSVFFSVFCRVDVVVVLIAFKEPCE